MSERLLAEASVPHKVILTGEHAIVHGRRGLAMALEPHLKVSLHESEGPAGVTFRSNRGHVVLDAHGNELERKTEDPADFVPFAEIVKAAMSKYGFTPNKRLTIHLETPGAPKGTGNSAAMSTGVAMMLFHAMGKVPRVSSKAEENDVFMLAYEGEKKAHGGAPSGVDNMTTYKGHTRLQRLLRPDKTTTWQMEQLDRVTFPDNTEIVIVDTHRPGEGARGSTGALVMQFAKAYELTKPGPDGTPVLKTLADLTPEDKARLAPFDAAYDDITQQLHSKGDPVALGHAMNRNHALLRAGGVSTPAVEKLIHDALAAGAYGAKGTGALGPGGAVILYLDKGKRPAIERVVHEHKLKLFSALATSGGAQLRVKAAPAMAHVIA